MKFSLPEESDQPTLRNRREIFENSVLHCRGQAFVVREMLRNEEPGLQERGLIKVGGAALQKRNQLPGDQSLVRKVREVTGEQGEISSVGERTPSHLQRENLLKLKNDSLGRRRLRGSLAEMKELAGGEGGLLLDLH